MNWRRFSAWFALGAFVLIVGTDVVLYFGWGPKATFSVNWLALLNSGSFWAPLFAIVSIYGAGVVTGHVLWSQKRRSK